MKKKKNNNGKEKWLEKQIQINKKDEGGAGLV